MQQRLDDLQLIRRVQRWPIPANLQAALVRRLIEAAGSAKAAGDAKATRGLIAVLRRLIDADRQNLAAEAQALAYLEKREGRAAPEPEALTDEERLRRLEELFGRVRERRDNEGGGSNGQE